MSRTRPTKIVLITGCSSGIGRASAKLLLQRGHTVAATARRSESLDSLRDEFFGFGARAVVDRLDVSDPQSIAPVVERLLRDHGRLDAVVNNAAYGQAGAVEQLTAENVRRQFEVNVIGVLNVTQAASIALRASEAPRIINVSSVVAHVPLPMMGIYCASKAALDSLTTCMRMETGGGNVRLVLIEPGAVKTEFRETAMRSVPESADSDDQGYARAYRGWRRRWNDRLGEAAAPPEKIARVIMRAVEARRPRARYRVTWAAKLSPFAYPFLPDRIADRILSRMFGVKPRRP